MPRNANGIYSLPVAAFVSGTVIKSADMNSDLSDIADALTGSLATNGVSIMTAPLPFFAGSVTAPGLGVAGDTDTGIFSPALNTLAISTAGTVVGTFNPDSSVIWTGLHTFNGGLTAGSVITFSSGATWNLNANVITIDDATTANQLINAMGMNYTLTFTIDGGGAVPSTGHWGYITVPCASTVIAWYIFADQSGSAVVDVNKSTYAGFPPTVSIAGSEKPTLSNTQKNSDTNLTTWTTSLNAFDVLGFDLDSVSSLLRLQVILVLERNSQ